MPVADAMLTVISAVPSRPAGKSVTLPLQGVFLIPDDIGDKPHLTRRLFIGARIKTQRQIPEGCGGESRRSETQELTYGDWPDSYTLNSAQCLVPG